MHTEASKLNRNVYLEVSKSDPISDITSFIKNYRTDRLLDIFIGNKLNASIRCTIISEDIDQFLYEIKILKGRFLDCTKSKCVYIYVGKDKKNIITQCRKEAFTELIQDSIAYIKEEINFLSQK